MNPGLCLILRIFVDSFCSGQAKSRCGGVLAIDFNDLYRQHSFRFHAFGTILLWFALTLTSSISFGEYLNSGATYTKSSRNGKNPRPAGQPTTVRFDLAAVWFMILSPRTSQLKGGSSKIHKLRSKSLNQVKMGSMPITNQRIETQTGLRSNVDPVNNVPERRTPEPS